ncbi:DEAD/DEAH box helicase [Alishewanella sp. HL-SH06]|uniref:DEAD/DEAH box helicase n=1 Tax=Alishewanella sp. HL-SH06 TaxID=3461144 RepID=UPI0040427A51
MGIRDLIRGFRTSGQTNLLHWRIDPVEGVDFIIDRKALADEEGYAIRNPYFGMQLAYLKGMLEQNKAVRNADGFTILSQDIVGLGEDFITLFDFPDFYPGSFNTRFEGNTGKAAFNVALELMLPGGDSVPRFTVFGPLLKLADNEMYMLQPAEWRAVQALKFHQGLAADKRGEYENNWLVFQLQLAKRAGMKINLAHFENLEVFQPEKVGVAVDTLPNGDLILTPSFGSGVNIDDIHNRLGQVGSDDKQCILRVKNKFVLLDEQRLEATKEILTNRRIPKAQVASFLKSPTAYLNAALIDLDTGFSLRVHGAEKFCQRYFGDVEKSGVNWFGNTDDIVEPVEKLTTIIDDQQKLDEVRALFADAQKTGADMIDVDGCTFDVSDKPKVQSTLDDIQLAIDEGRLTPKPAEQGLTDEEVTTTERAVVAIDSNDDSIEYSKDSRVTGLDLSQITFSSENLKRLPFPHQDEGVRWFLAHLEQIKSTVEPSGAMLADDMGLGKTYMTLVAIAEWYRCCNQLNEPQKPVLIVAPLSLIENWQAEVAVTFNQSPFSDIVVLQAGGDLSRFRLEGAGRETLQEFVDDDLIQDADSIRYALKIGKVYGSDRLDLPRRLVLTTYQTLRDYQFSLSRVDWSIAAFDEAQNLKNPNALSTRAAKGLKADFKLLATGTPVENTLKDFWCLFDTAVPGLLGAWQAFRKDFIAPILSASAEQVNQVRVDVGRELRKKVGDYMLRRTKAEKLKGLPEKRIFSGDAEADEGSYLPVLSAVMSGPQLAYYDDIITSVKSCKPEEKRMVILPSLRKLKVASIHHEIDAKAAIPKVSNELLKQAQLSVKLQSLVAILKEIEKRAEKVLVFAETKAVQAYICALVTSIFKVQVEIINGDTQAVSTKHETQTRKAIIDRFQTAAGFGVIVMSPVAAGVGLTVVGANNVIHVERHWNPAKEAQATDRVYRIGQTRDVNVYIPMALHPKLRSFDQHLNGLLANKVDLSDAVVANPTIEPSDLAGCF